MSNELKALFSFKTRMLMRMVRLADVMRKWCWKRMPGFCEKCGVYAGMSQVFSGGNRLCPKCFDIARKGQGE